MNSETSTNKALRQKAIVALLIAAGFLVIFNEVEMNIALPTISVLYNVPVSTAQWLTTGYMLVAGTLMPLSAFALGRLGARRCVLGSLLVLLVGIVITLLASALGSFGLLLAGRLVQAVCAAFFIPSMMTVVLSIAPPEKFGTYNGLMMLVLMFAPAIGPTISGFILSALGATMLFGVLVPFHIAALVGLAGALDKSPLVRGESVDILSIVLSILGFGGIVYGVGNIASQSILSPAVIAPLAVGTVALAIYTRRQLASDAPLLNVRILGNVRYRSSLALIVVMQAILFGTILVVPLFPQSVWGLSALEAGLYMLPGGFATAAANYAAGAAYDRAGLKAAPYGIAVAAIGYAGTAATFQFGLSPIALIAFCALYSAALPFALTAFSSNSLASLEQSQIPDGSSMNNTLQQIFGSLGTALFTAIIYATASDASTASVSLLSGSVAAMWFASIAAIMVLVAFLLLRSKMSYRKNVKAPSDSENASRDAAFARVEA